MRRTAEEVTLRDWLGLAERHQRVRLPGTDRGLPDPAHPADPPRRHLARERAGRGSAAAASAPAGSASRRRTLVDVVTRCAKRFGDSQLAQCANQVSSDLMPHGAALHSYSELYTSTADVHARRAGARCARSCGWSAPSGSRAATWRCLREIADPHFEQATDVGSVLWLNGLLGYVDGTAGRRSTPSATSRSSTCRRTSTTYVLHPCLASSVGLVARPAAAPVRETP